MLKISIIVAGFEPQNSLIFDPFFEAIFILSTTVSDHWFEDKKGG